VVGKPVSFDALSTLLEDQDRTKDVHP
jgi:hypothetical protein